MSLIVRSEYQSACQRIVTSVLCCQELYLYPSTELIQRLSEELGVFASDARAKEWSCQYILRYLPSYGEIDWSVLTFSPRLFAFIPFFPAFMYYCWCEHPIHHMLGILGDREVWNSDEPAEVIRERHTQRAHEDEESLENRIVGDLDYIARRYEGLSLFLEYFPQLNLKLIHQVEDNSYLMTLLCQEERFDLVEVIYQNYDTEQNTYGFDAILCRLPIDLSHEHFDKFMDIFLYYTNFDPYDVAAVVYLRYHKDPKRLALAERYKRGPLCSHTVDAILYYIFTRKPGYWNPGNNAREVSILLQIMSDFPWYVYGETRSIYVVNFNLSTEENVDNPFLEDVLKNEQPCCVNAEKIGHKCFDPENLKTCLEIWIENGGKIAQPNQVFLESCLVYNPLLYSLLREHCYVPFSS